MQVKSLTKQFATQKAIDDVSFTLPKGKLIGLIGPDGAGKTTLIRLLAGLLTPTSGQVIRDSAEIGYMPQKFGLYEDLTVLQNLNLYADLQGVADKEATFKRLLQFTGLLPFQDRLAGNLSGGMKQKLGLACALMKRPPLLLLDEPSVGVDPISRRELWTMVSELLKEEVSILWSTTYLDEAQKCDEVLLLNNGKLLYQGSPKDFTGKAKNFEEAFVNMLGGLPTGESKLAAIRELKGEEGAYPIVAEQLTKQFGSFTAAENISFQVKKGEIFGLLGPNGAGKTTTFKMLCGLLKPTSGKAEVNGLDLAIAPSEARAQIGYMAQKFSLYNTLTVKQNLSFFAGIYDSKIKADEMIEIFSLQKYLASTPDELPLGIKQRLALACANMHNPPLLFLDEPTSGVDPLTRKEFWNHIHGLVKKGITVMVTTHFMDEAENCDRIALIFGGKIIHLDTPANLKNLAKTKENPNPTLEDAFIKLINATP